jgi:hypothetical protein
MRTKTLLLSAAALAAGVLGSQAQSNVYSANVVGYVNVVIPPGKFVMVANPFATGNDVLSNIVAAPGGSTAQIWNGAGFDAYTYSALAHAWKNGAINGNLTPLPPGVGFFLTSSGGFTNTFVGSVIANNGTSVTNSLGTTVTTEGSAIPYMDTVTNGTTVNLTVGGGSTLQQWSVSGQTFNAFTYSSLAHNWKQGATTTNPVIAPGEGFFLQASAPTNWVQTLNLQ